MRLIDADALCRHLSDWQFGSMTDGKHDAEYEVINKVIDGIEKEPTVKPIKVGDVCKECWRDGGNVVEVVRCKDCEHWKREENHAGEIGDDYFCAFGQNKSYREDFFCADGERKKQPKTETKTDHWGYERLFCPNCKAQYTKGQRYCDNCGQKLI